MASVPEDDSLYLADSIFAAGTTAEVTQRAAVSVAAGVHVGIPFSVYSSWLALVVRAHLPFQGRLSASPPLPTLC